MRLAALDSAPIPFGPVLLAEVDGEAKAAIVLRDETVIADPFSRTSELVDLLRLHARSVQDAAERRADRVAFGGLRVAA
jgi:hypothetical protein